MRALRRCLVFLALGSACASDGQYVRRGDELISQQNFQDAQAEYFKALELNPNLPSTRDALRELGAAP